jgi:hypothetical protein
MQNICMDFFNKEFSILDFIQIVDLAANMVPQLMISPTKIW